MPGSAWCWGVLHYLDWHHRAVVYFACIHCVHAPPCLASLTASLHPLHPTHTHPQLVDKLDAGEIPSEVCGHSYQALYRLVSQALFQAHVEGRLKAEIVQEPEKYVELDPDMAQTLLDQAQSGKKLCLITNSDYAYTHQLMSYAYNRFLPDGMTWRDLFDMVRGQGVAAANNPPCWSPRQCNQSLCVAQDTTAAAGHCAGAKARFFQPQHVAV